MDSLTQFTLGAAIGEASVGRKAGAKAALIGGLIGTLPDLDSFIPYGSAVASFTFHRSFSHSLIVLALVAPLVAWLLLMLLRPPPEQHGRWLLLVFLVLLTHPLLDAFTVYGTQLLWPLSEHPYSGSTIFIVDPAYTLPLAIGVLLALTFNRRSRWRAPANQAGLLISSLYLAWSVAAFFLVREGMREELERRGIDYERLLVNPAPLNTLLWRAVVMAEGGYFEAWYPLLESGHPVDMTWYADDKQLLEPIAEHWPVQRLQWFTHGFYAVHEKDGKILMADLRMGLAPEYIFTFQVGRRGPEGIVPVHDALVPGEWSARQLQVVWERLRRSLQGDSSTSY